MNSKMSNYGAASRDLVPREYGDSASKPNLSPFYLTTAISYTNGDPHIGHAYEFIIADIITRYYRVFGHKSYFLTGADEHGQKVAASAEKAGRSPKDHCDYYVNKFKLLDEMLNISYNRYIRTTDDDHISTSQKLWKICSKDIYLGSYEGWYNEREECFVTDSDALASEYKDPGSGNPLKKVKEESYFFKMSLFCERLVQHIELNPKFIQPETHRNGILTRLRWEGLKDLSISRTSFHWGIPVPDHADHVMYVWFDALTNYLSGINALEMDPETISSFWPPTVQIIGKDIVWFHGVIWPCMLMSAGLPLPECIYSHGFVNAADGRKMSKSYNNAVDPFDMLSKYPSDSIRYYLASSVTHGADLNFSLSGLVAMHNNELADILGNLVHRILNLCKSYCNGCAPDCEASSEFGVPYDVDSLIDGVVDDMKVYAINVAIFKVMEAARNTNGYLQRAEPWKLKGPENELRRKQIVRMGLEALYIFTHFLAPVMPIASGEIFSRLHTEPIPSYQLKARGFNNLMPGCPIDVGNILFQKIESPDAPEPTVAATKAAAAATTAKEEDDPNQQDFSKLDLRVGRIVKIWPHESSDKLYCEEIDVGDSSIRQVASGLRHSYDIDSLLNRLVVVIVNMREAKLAGFMSYGIVLATSSPELGITELIDPPADSVVGERIMIEGVTGNPWNANKIKKNKVWDIVKVDLAVNSVGHACWRGLELRTPSGICSTASLRNTPIY